MRTSSDEKETHENDKPCNETRADQQRNYAKFREE